MGSKKILAIGIVVLIVLAGVVVARWRSPLPKEPPKEVTTQHPPTPPAQAPASAPPAPTQAKDEYDLHYAQGLVFMADKKYDEALAEFQKAQAIANTVEVAAQIEKIKQVLGDAQQAEQLAREVDALRQAGKLEEASQKAAAGVEKYWNTPSGPRLAELKKAIDSDIARQAADKKTLAEQNYQKAQSFYKQGDLRNAYIILAETAKYTDDPKIAGLYEDAKSRVTLYDESLSAADAYMRDPDTYEDAIAALEIAQKAWDTQEVRDRLEAARLALKNRRERVAVVDFDVKGEFDIPNAGSAIPELLLPRFQTKYDIIERTQLNKLLQEYNLQMSDLVEPAKVSASLPKIKRVNYLVMGSLIRFGDIHLTARKVEVRSGLIERTGKISTPRFDDIDSYLDDLAAQLTLSEEEYRAYMERKVKTPAPSTLPVGDLAPSQITYVFEGLTQSQLDALDEGAVLSDEPPATWREEQFKRELYENIMALGREFMGKRQYYEASRQFEMALTIYPEDARAMALLSEAYRLMSYTPQPPSMVRERIAVLDFLSFGPPQFPFAGSETADLLASYLSRQYDVVDRGQLLWHMRRWNLPLRQIISSRQRLMWIGRLFSIRYVVIGYLAPATSFDVVAQVLDTQTGFVHSRVRMRVNDREELRFRMADFAQALFLRPDERRAWIEQSDRRFDLLRNGRECMRENKFASAMKFFAELISLLQPDRDQAYFAEARRAYDEADWQVRRTRPVGPILIAPTDLDRLTRERREAERRAEEMRKQLERNYKISMDQGYAAMAAADYAAAMRAFASAMNFRKTREAEQAYATAKKRAEREKAQWAANAEAERRYRECMDAGKKKLLLGRFADAIKEFENALNIRRTSEAQAALLDAQRQFAEFQRRQREAAETDRRTRDAERIERAYAGYMSAARKHMEKQDHQEALSNYSRAIALKKTPEAEAGLRQAQQYLAQQQQKEQEAAEQKRREHETSKKEKDREKPPAPAKEDQEYSRHMAEGRERLEKGDPAAAAQAFAKAYGIRKTDEAHAAYDDASRKAADAARTAEDAKRQRDEQTRKEKDRAQQAVKQAQIDREYADAIADGRRKMEAGKFAEASKDFARALQLKETPEAQALLKQAQQAQRDQESKAKKEEAEKKAREEQRRQEAERRAAVEKAQEETREQIEKAKREAASASTAIARLEKRFHACKRLFTDLLKSKKSREERAAIFQQAKAEFEAAQAEMMATLKKEGEDAQQITKQIEELSKALQQGRITLEQYNQQSAPLLKKLEQSASGLDVKSAEALQEAHNQAYEALKTAEMELAKEPPQKSEAPKESPMTSSDARQEAERQKREREKQEAQEREKLSAEEKERTDAMEKAYQRYMESGQLNMRRKRFEAAMKNFADALNVKKTAEAQAAYEQARTALDNTKAEEEKARQQETLRKQQEEQQKAQEQADRKAAELKRKEDETRRKAEERAAEEQKRRQQEAQKAAEEQARQSKIAVAYQERFNAGLQLEQQGRFEEAMQSFRDAYKIMQTDEARQAFERAKAKLEALKQQAHPPKEPSGSGPQKRPDEQAIRQQKEQERAQREAQERAAKIEEAYQKYMNSGHRDMQRGRFEDAMKNYSNAYKIKPTDEAKAAYESAQRSLQQQQHAPPGEQHETGKKKRR